mmetsp:Transcript_31813/g.69615  ORF Transcript_31813/g.69615 Transcript_31813/m.69615 type:complete len:269 (-) Transcript_31813:277-1083(-)
MKLFVAVAVAAALDTEQVDVTMSGMQCGGSSQQDGVIIRPKDTTQKYPLISFAHGWRDGGKTLDGVYQKLWPFIASNGYIIVAAKAPDGLDYCLDMYKDQLQAIRWALGATEVKDSIDTSLPKGLMGHSMGGRSTVLAASQASDLKELNVGAAVAEHPAVNVGGCPSCAPAVPIMFTAGEKDDVVPHGDVSKQYEAASGVPKAYVEIKGADHHDCSTGPDLQGLYVLDFLNCYIKGNATACQNAQCKESGIPTSDCKSAGFPSVDIVV